ncbi:hypothetical protein [Streptomyces sp. NBC_00996]|uniref:hypothetical protein n=1 Tax=Streptomyces sp. NBC_00996 TaxID=2903710 RepID=UPI0038657F72|nr:hypothetical protein OG390_26055 [Streptomyces sp. NBC_00996]
MTAPRSLPSDPHDRLLAMRAKRRLVDGADVETAIEEVDNSQLVPLLEEFVHLPRGRHRTLHLRNPLIGLHLCTQDTGGKIVLERVTDILYFRISPQLRARLDIPEYEDHDQGFEAAYAVVRRIFHAMKDAMNPAPLTPNGHLSRMEANALTAAADVDELAERERRLALFTEFVLDASVRSLHDLLAELTEVSLGIDATPVRTFSRGRRTNGPELATDPDAGWYVREGDHRDPDAPVSDSMRPSPPPVKKGKAKTSLVKKKASLKKKYLFGYDAHLIVTRDAEHDDVVLLDDGTPNPDVLPVLVLGVALDKPGHRPAYNGVKILNRMQERGYQPGYLAGDRAYNNSEPDEWQLPIRAMGYKPVYDYRGDQLGKQAETDGAILVEGRWYCPSMPEPLINATIDLHAERIDQETWIRLIAARRGYRIMPKENADADGYQRMMCPAEAGKAQCPIKPHTLGRGVQPPPLVDPEPSPAGPLKVCRQRTITVSPETGAKHWQALEYGGPEWQKIYFRLRNSVEGHNGYAKNPLAEGIEAAGSRRIRGIAARTILLAFQLAHANRRKIKKWLETLALGGERPRRRTHHKRKTKDRGTWTHPPAIWCRPPDPSPRHPSTNRRTTSSAKSRAPTVR